MHVTVDTFKRAETARMFDGLLAFSGGVNRFFHYREPVAIDRQNVIRMNRDTLYSAAIVNISEGAVVTLPDAGDRYLSVMVIDEEHYLERVLREPGSHTLTMEEFGSEFVAVAGRILVDPNDPGDLGAVHRLQDGLLIDAAASTPYTHPDFDQSDLDAIRELLIRLNDYQHDSRNSFGPRNHVDPVRHLIGTASGWGGLPETEAFYVIDTEPRSEGRFRMTLGDVPVEAFWSMTIYNRDGYLEPNPYDSYSVNSVTAVRSEDGSVTIDMAPSPTGEESNFLAVMDGWNFAFRLYRPLPEVLDGSWSLPPIEPV